MASGYSGLLAELDGTWILHTNTSVFMNRPESQVLTFILLA